MESDTKLEDEDIDAIAREAAGVDVDVLRADMKSTAIQQELADSMALARDLGVNGHAGLLHRRGGDPGCQHPENHAGDRGYAGGLTGC